MRMRQKSSLFFLIAMVNHAVIPRPRWPNPWGEGGPPILFFFLPRPVTEWIPVLRHCDGTGREREEEVGPR